MSPLALGIILAVGLTIGLALLFAFHITIPLGIFNLTPSWLLGGSILFGVCSVVSAVYFTVHGANTCMRQKNLEKTPLPLPIERNEVSPEEWTERLKNPKKDIITNPFCPTNDTLYYDLTNVYTNQTDICSPQTLKLGMQGDFLQIPHLGDYCSKDEKFSPDDVAMAVRLPDSQIAAFPEEIQKAFAQKKELELYFLIFRNLNKTKTKCYNASLHAMAFGNYNPDPFIDDVPSKGQEFVRDEAFGKILKTELRILMCDTDGIDDRFDGTGAFKNQEFTDFTLSIHPDGAGHAFSENIARFKVEDDSQIASMFVAAQFLGRAVAFHALIINDPDSEEGQKLDEITRADNLQIFMDGLQDSKFIYAEKVRHTLRGADPNPASD